MFRPIRRFIQDSAATVAFRYYWEQSNPSFGRAIRLYRQKLRWLNAPSVERERVQQDRLIALLNFAAKFNPFYRERLRDSGFGTAREWSPERFADVLPLRRGDLQECYAQLVSDSSDHLGWERNSSGGSTGDPVNFIQDQEFREEALATMYVSDTLQGWQPGSRRALLWGAPKDKLRLKSARDKVHYFLKNERLYDSFDMSVEQMRSFHHNLTDFRPNVILAYSSSIFLFARFLKDAGLKPSYPRVSIISSAEMLTPAMRSEIESVFGVPVYDRYGSRELGCIASECEAHCSLHLHPSDHYVEVVDDGGRPVWDQPGRILVTLLTNRAMPLIRYEVGDLGVLTVGTCKCGRQGAMLKTILGRSSDFVVVSDGRLVHGEYFTHAIYGVDGVKQFQFIQESLIEFRLLLVTVPGFPQARVEKIKSEMLEVLGARSRLTVEFYDAIPHSPSGKHRFTISKLDPAAYMAGDAMARTNR
jgi:phenylacetate-CoA ligase